MDLKSLIKERPIVFFDVETTGKNVNSDRIIEICMVKIQADGSREVYEKRINPDGYPIHPEAQGKHGISESDLVGAPTFKEIAREIFEFIDNCDLGGYNILNFDIPIIVEEFMRAGILYNPRKVRIIDVYRIYQKFEARDLSSTYKRFCGKELTNAHEAKADVLATMEIFEAQGDIYPEISSVESVHQSTVGTLVDLARKIEKREDGDFYYTFGKHRDKKFFDVMKSDPNYATWIIEKGEFTKDTKIIVQKLVDTYKQSLVQNV